MSGAGQTALTMGSNLNPWRDTAPSIKDGPSKTYALQHHAVSVKWQGKLFSRTRQYDLNSVKTRAQSRHRAAYRIFLRVWLIDRLPGTFARASL